MEITTISGRDVTLIYSPHETDAIVGTAYAIRELPEKKRGIIVQVIENSSLNLDGFLIGQVQTLLEKTHSDTHVLYNAEQGLDAVQQIKAATCKIRANLCGETWSDFNGWVPGRACEITRVTSQELLDKVVQSPHVPMREFLSYDQQPVVLDGTRLGQCSLLLGNKGRGKSHTLKQLTIAMQEYALPVVIFDMNYEYRLPDFQCLRLGRNYWISLSEAGPSIIETLVSVIAPLPPGSNSESTLSTRLTQFFRERREKCQAKRQPYTIDLPYLIDKMWSANEMVQGAITDRLTKLHDMRIFAEEVEHGKAHEGTLAMAYETACVEGRPIVFEFLPLSSSVRSALFRATMQTLEHICERERADGTERYPQIVCDEGHFYARDADLINAITRSRHIGWSVLLATNSPELIPNVVLRLLDNLIVLPISHEDDVRIVSKAAASFCDKTTIESLIRSLPDRHAIIMGGLTSRWPLVVKIGPLPDFIPPTGVTRSPWTRLLEFGKRE